MQSVIIVLSTVLLAAWYTVAMSLVNIRTAVVCVCVVGSVIQVADFAAATSTKEYVPSEHLVLDPSLEDSYKFAEALLKNLSLIVPPYDLSDSSSGKALLEALRHRMRLLGWATSYWNRSLEYQDPVGVAANENAKCDARHFHFGMGRPQLPQAIPKCTSAVYYYAVVSGQLSCPEPCAKESSRKTTGGVRYGDCDDVNEAHERVCKDIGNSHNDRRACDPVVYVGRGSNSKNVDNTMPWMLRDMTPIGTYRLHYTIRGEIPNMQYIARVEDVNVNEQDCATLVVGVKDCDYGEEKKRKLSPLPHGRIVTVINIIESKLSAKDKTRTPLPLPKDDCSIMFGKLYKHTVSYKTAATCPSTNHNQPIMYNVTFIYGIMEATIGNQRRCNTDSKYYNCKTRKLNHDNVKAEVSRLTEEITGGPPKRVSIGDHNAFSYKEWKERRRSAGTGTIDEGQDGSPCSLKGS